jgi:DNA-binding response OmpR family regulator
MQNLPVSVQDQTAEQPNVSNLLRKKELQLFSFLYKNRGRTVNRFSILEQVWNCSAGGYTNTMEVHMSSLRRKLEKLSGAKLIRTIHGVGYMINPALSWPSSWPGFSGT